MFRNESAKTKDFGLVPKSDIPRSLFRQQRRHITAMNASDLVPIFVRPVNPGDTWKLHATLFGRLATPLFPFMDNLYLDTFFFFVPCRLVWENFKKFMGEQRNPGDSISYTMPQITSPSGGYAIGSIYDYMGLPTVGQVNGSATISHDALPLRCDALIWNQWFRDENLQNSVTVHLGDGPDTFTDYTLRKRNKRADYFTTCLPSPQKGTTAATLPMSGTAPITGLGWISTATGSGIVGGIYESDGTLTNTYTNAFAAAGTGGLLFDSRNDGLGNSVPNVFADMNNVTSATINALRTAVTLQQFLEKDARGGTRYIEIILSHFNVQSPDARQQRAEYLGGGSQRLQVRPVEQTSSSDATSPQGNLAAFAEVVANHGFKQSFTEHGYILGYANVRADLTYQQGIERWWLRQTRYDWPWPIFANLGEQAVTSREIYATGEAGDSDIFGYQERYAEERYMPSMVTGVMRSTAANNIDVWHLAQEFGSRPTLNSTFITENVPLERILAVQEEAAGQQLILDMLFTVDKVTSLPQYGVPGLFRF